MDSGLYHPPDEDSTSVPWDSSAEMSGRLVSPKPIVTAVTKQAEISPTEKFMATAASFSQLPEPVARGRQWHYRASSGHVDVTSQQTTGLDIASETLSTVDRDELSSRQREQMGDQLNPANKGRLQQQTEGRSEECHRRDFQADGSQVRLLTACLQSDHSSCHLTSMYL